ncbi:hypothetical protein BJ165DRAFT_1410264 [Panaeolus papilionaceus]|nr:hypothetical protein BJ165DRAFT_1410264 [Panaeolus papilionaceus]
MPHVVSVCFAQYKERKPDIIGVWMGMKEQRCNKASPLVPITDFKELLNPLMPPGSDPNDEDYNKNDTSMVEVERAWCTREPQGFTPYFHGTVEDPFNVPSWHTSKISEFTSLFHVKLKRLVSRRIENPCLFFAQLDMTMMLADASADKQSSLIFRSECKTQRIITILAAGEWWAWKISVRGGRSEPLFPKTEEAGEAGNTYGFLDQYFSDIDGKPVLMSLKRSELPPQAEDNGMDVDHFSHLTPVTNPADDEAFYDSDKDKDLEEVHSMVNPGPDKEPSGDESESKDPPGALSPSVPVVPHSSKKYVYCYLRHVHKKEVVKLEKAHSDHI